MSDGILKINVFNMQDLVNADQIEETDGDRRRQRKTKKGRGRNRN